MARRMKLGKTEKRWKSTEEFGGDTVYLKLGYAIGENRNLGYERAQLEKGTHGIKKIRKKKLRYHVEINGTHQKMSPLYYVLLLHI